MKYLVIFMAILMAIPSANSQTYANILPNTKYCAPGSEAHTSSYCVDSTPCKTISGISVCLQGTPDAVKPPNSISTTFSCWSITTDYTCQQAISGCALYTANPACSEAGAPVCTTGASGLPMVSNNPKLGACLSYERDFKCLPNGVATTTSTTTCDPVNMLNGLDWSVASPSAQTDFVNAVTSQELARQIATYGYKNDQLDDLFHGQSMDCRNGWVGLKNCCASSPGGAKSNSVMATTMGNVAMSAVTWAISSGTGYALKAGAPYVYDLMMSDVAPAFMQSGVASMASSMQANTLGAGGGIGAMGFGTSASSAAGLMASSGSSIQIMNSPLFFNPYAFAFAIAVMVVMEAISCAPEEKTLGNLRGQNLCHAIGSYCSMSTAFGCMETKQEFCCFNGLLAKGIMEGAHTQLGISWGTPQAPNCSGLSISQLKSINFSDPIFTDAMAPFNAEVMNNYNATSGVNMANGSFKTNIQDTATHNIHALCLQKQTLDPSVVCQ